MRRGERIPLHDHSDFNSGGLIDTSITILTGNDEGGGSGGEVIYGLPVAIGTALAAGATGAYALASHVHTNAYLGTLLVYGTAGSAQVLTAQGPGSATWADASAGTGGASALVFSDEGTAIGTPTVVDFVGAGVTASYSGGTATVTITGGSVDPSIIVQDEGSTIGTATVLNFTGAGGTASFSGGTATINIAGGGGGGGTTFSSAYGSAVLTSPGLLAYWPLQDASGPFIDEARGERHGSMVGFGSATFGTAGTVTDDDLSIGFNGSNNYISTAAPQAFQSEITIAAWVKGTATSRRTIYNNRAANNGVDFGWGSTGGGHGGNGQFRIAIDGSGIDYGRHTTAAYNDGNWHFAVGVIGPVGIGTAFGSADFQVYVDGTACTMASGLTGAPASPINNLTTLYYAFIGKSAQASSPWMGQMAHVAVWRRALGTAEITALYTAGTAA